MRTRTKTANVFRILENVTKNKKMALAYSIAIFGVGILSLSYNGPGDSWKQLKSKYAFAQQEIDMLKSKLAKEEAKCKKMKAQHEKMKSQHANMKSQQRHNEDAHKTIHNMKLQYENMKSQYENVIRDMKSPHENTEWKSKYFEIRRDYALCMDECLNCKTTLRNVKLQYENMISQQRQQRQPQKEWGWRCDEE